MYCVDIRHRYEDRHETLLAEVGRLQVVAARVDQLENENRSLVRELDQLRSKQGTSPPPGARPALAEISANTKLDALATGVSGCGPEDAIDWVTFDGSDKRFDAFAVFLAFAEPGSSKLTHFLRFVRLQVLLFDLH